MRCATVCGFVLGTIPPTIMVGMRCLWNEPMLVAVGPHPDAPARIFPWCQVSMVTLGVVGGVVGGLAVCISDYVLRHVWRPRAF